MHNLTTTTLIGFLVVLAIVAGLLLAYLSNRGQQELLSITNFDQCVAAGNPVMPARRSLGAGGESYPEQCRTSDGRLFVNERQATQVPSPSGRDSEENAPLGACAIAGCSGQLCVPSEEAGDVFTTCEYRAEYACYQSARCERQADGACGWTQTDELQRCLERPPSVDPSDLQVF